MPTWKNDNSKNETGNIMEIKSEELEVDPLHLRMPRIQTAEIDNISRATETDIIDVDPD
jgi:hypothetical protein